jgi:hypothetical protein
VTHELLEQLREQSPAIHVRWETLLRVEPVVSPLASPDALTLLIPDTIAKVLTALAAAPRRSLSLRDEAADRIVACDCGHNPYRAFFVAGEQACVETLVLLQAKQPAAKRRESDMAELIRAVRRIAAGEIDTFCSICTDYRVAASCRHSVSR